MQESLLPLEVEVGETVEIVLPFLPKSKNQYDTMPFMHKRGYKQKWRRHLDEQIPMLQLGTPDAIHIEVELWFGSKRRRDWQNYVHPLHFHIADALVDAGVIPDDTPDRYTAGANGGIVFKVDRSPAPTAQRQRTVIKFTPLRRVA